MRKLLGPIKTHRNMNEKKKMETYKNTSSITDTMRNRRFKIYGHLKWILTELKNILIYTVKLIAKLRFTIGWWLQEVKNGTIGV